MIGLRDTPSWEKKDVEWYENNLEYLASNGIKKIEVDIPCCRIIQALCGLASEHYPKGCPNYNNPKRPECCEPRPKIGELLDLNKDVYVIYTEFRVGKFAERMKRKHRDWSLRRQYNPRPWQPKIKKFQEALENIAIEKGLVIDNCPEGHGVELTPVMKSIGVQLYWDWPPKSYDSTTFRISLGGQKLKTN
jgi:hypothetical protein